MERYGAVINVPLLFLRSRFRCSSIRPFSWRKV